MDGLFKVPGMAIVELNPIHQQLEDLGSRCNALRGYL
jgi:hypothetical protein